MATEYDNTHLDKIRNPHLYLPEPEPVGIFEFKNGENICQEIDAMREYFLKHQKPANEVPIFGINRTDFFEENLPSLPDINFEKDIKKFCKSVGEKYVVGSAALFIYLSREGRDDYWGFTPNDVDIFTTKDYEKAYQIRDISVLNVRNHSYKFQLIKKDNCKTPQRFVSNFDIGCCKIIYNVETDSFDQTNPLILEAINKRNVPYYPQDFNYKDGKLKKQALARIIKYMNRGFQVGDFVLKDVIAEFNKSQEDPDGCFYSVEKWNSCRNKFSTIYRKLLEHNRKEEATIFYDSSNKFLQGAIDAKNRFIREKSAKRFSIENYPNTPLIRVMKILTSFPELKISGSSVFSLFGGFKPNDIDVYYNIKSEDFDIADIKIIHRNRGEISLFGLNVEAGVAYSMYESIQKVYNDHLVNNLVGRIKKILGIDGHTFQEGIYEQKVIKIEYQNFNIQLINNSFKIDDFDMDFCKAFIHNGEIVMYPDVLEAIETNRSDYKPKSYNFEGTKLNEASIERVNRYISRGLKLFWRGKEIKNGGEVVI